MYLGIDKHTGLIYEGTGGPDIPSIPTPAVTQAKIVSQVEDLDNLPRGVSTDAFSWVFREDSFDPVSRTRRGRLYEPHLNTQPQQVRVSPHPYDFPGRWPGVSPEINFQKSLFVYTQCSQLLAMPSKGIGATLALGSPQAVSLWRIVQTEMLATRAVMVTLKALSTYHILPEIETIHVTDEFRVDVKRVHQKVLDAAFRESPDSVVDRCRNALAVLMSRWLVQQGFDRKILESDLGGVSETISKPPYSKICAANMGRTVAQLHNRNKDNVLLQKGLRPLVEEDAELSIHAIGLTLRDLGWAKAA